jgi:hypothetical protein
MKPETFNQVDFLTEPFYKFCTFCFSITIFKTRLSFTSLKLNQLAPEISDYVCFKCIEHVKLIDYYIKDRQCHTGPKLNGYYQIVLLLNCFR